MALIPPPPPLSNETFQDRWNKGARTLEEIDPDLCKWAKTVKHAQYMTLAGIILMVVLFVIAGVMLVI